MRTAVLMSGLPREIEMTWRSLQRFVVNRLPGVDFFIYSGEHYPVDERVYQALKVKMYMVEPQFKHVEMEERINSHGYYAAEHLNAYIQQIYGLKKVWEMKKFYEQVSGVKYDYVFRTRPDLLWMRYFDIDEVGGGNAMSNFHPAPPKSITMSTEVAFGPDAAMEKYFGIYDWLLSDASKPFTTRENPRLSIQPDHTYTCDIYLTTYWLDYLKLPVADTKFPEAEVKWPYDVYRIVGRHLMNVY
jgi:hypothetical protein